jgi:hypothetical protein
MSVFSIYDSDATTANAPANRASGIDNKMEYW